MTEVRNMSAEATLYSSSFECNRRSSVELGLINQAKVVVISLTATTKVKEGERKSKMKIITTFHSRVLFSSLSTSALIISHRISHGPLGYRPCRAEFALLEPLICPFTKQVVSCTRRQSLRKTISDIVMGTDVRHRDNTRSNRPSTMMISHGRMLLIQCRFHIRRILNNAFIITKNKGRFSLG